MSDVNFDELSNEEIAKLDTNFSLDFNSVEVTDGFSVLPPGKYPCYVDNVQIKSSKTGNRYLNVTYKVFEGEFKNRLIFEIINAFHEKPIVRNIANQTLKKILTASKVDTSKLVIKSIDSLLDTLKTCRLNIGTKVEKNELYGDQVKVVGYSPLEEAKEKTIDTDEIPF